MARLKLSDAVKICEASLEKARQMNLNPMTVAVLDEGGQVTALMKEDGSARMRADIAVAKAYAALGMGVSSGVLEERAKDRPNFIDSLAAVSHGNFIPVAGGHLLYDSDGDRVGAVGVTGDQAPKDVECARAGIAAAGLTTDDK
jgi:uncharacterized protein GlcG (DUF336 family)